MKFNLIKVLIALAGSPLADLLVPKLAKLIGIDEAKLLAIIQWLGGLTADQQEVAVALAEPTFGAITTMAQAGCDCPDCPHPAELQKIVDYTYEVRNNLASAAGTP